MFLTIIKKIKKVLSLLENDKAKTEKKPVDLLADADVSRFDKAKKKKKKKPRRNDKNNRSSDNGGGADDNNDSM